MAKKKKIDKRTGTGIGNMGVGILRGKQQQMQDIMMGKQPKTLSSNPAKLRTNTRKKKKAGKNARRRK